MAAVALPLPKLVAPGGSLGSYLLGMASILGFWYVAGTIAWFAYRTDRVRRFIDPLVISIPLLGRAIIRLELSRYCRCFTSLYGAGVPATECARIAAGICHNRWVATQVRGGADSVLAGDSISEGFGPNLPPEFAITWRMGEESGTLEEVTRKLADRMSEDAEFVLQEIGRWTPRVIYAVIMVQLALMILSTWGALGG